MIEKMKQYNSLIAKYKLAEIFFERETDEVKVEDGIKRLQELTKEVYVLEKWFEASKIEVTDIEITEGFNLEYREKRFKKYSY